MNPKRVAKLGARRKLLSRNQNDLSQKFPEIRDALQHLDCQQALLDGEIVALDEQGRPSFEALQGAGAPASFRTRTCTSSHSRPIYYYAFDLLNLEGKDLTSQPLTARRALLESLLNKRPIPRLRCSSAFLGDPQYLVKYVQKLGLEGIIAKQADSRYQSGQRTGAWIKYKFNLEQEFVIGGYTPANGTRPFFGALIVGYYQDGKLCYASKVGTGFTDRTLENLYRRFQPLIVPRCPFVDLPLPRKSQFGQGITAAEMKHCIWLRPELVCQVRFTEWTSGGHLRHPSFIALRDDKSPTEVIREAPADT